MKVRIQVNAPRAVDRESLKAPLTASMVLHGLLFGLMLFGGVLVTPNRGQEWGDEGLGGGIAVPVNLSPSVPLPPSAGPENPLASATREVHPAERKPPERQPAPQPSPRELQLTERDLKKKLAEMERRRVEQELAQLQQRFPREAPPGAIPGTTSSGRASSPVYGMATGQGSGGIGFSGDFGTLYGWYVRAVRDCIARHWDRGRIDAALRTAPRVYVEFHIQRDGRITGERVSTSSGIPSIDREAVRAIQACSGRSDVGAEARLPELPRDYSGSSVRVEVWFEFRR